MVDCVWICCVGALFSWLFRVGFLFSASEFAFGLFVLLICCGVFVIWLCLVHMFVWF